MRHPFLRSAGSELKDPNFKNVTLLLHGDGTNGGQNNTFVDGSTNNFSITRNGNTTQGTFSPYGDNWSNYFDGTGDYLSTPSNAAFDFGSGDFTIECWVYVNAFPPANSGGRIICRRASAGNKAPFDFWIDPNGAVVFSMSSNGSTWVFDLGFATSAITRSTWTHLAVVRNGSNWAIYVNGISSATQTSSASVMSSSAAITTGALGDGTYALNAYISNLRVLKGTAQYTANFTAPTAPLTAITNTSLLTCQSNRFRDASTNNFTITRNGDVSVQRFSPFSPTAAYAAGTIGGSGNFSASNQYLACGSNSAFAFGTGDFTVECWYYPTTTSTTNQYAYVTDSVGGLCFGFENGAFVLGRRSQSPADLSYTYNVVPNQWLHLVAVRSGSTASLFLNGVRVATGTVTTNYSVTGPVQVGGFGFGYTAVGYLSNLRTVKGTAVYDPTQTTLTVPTAPLTAITNTSLLLNFTNAAILDNAMMAVPETVGNAQIDTTIKKFGTGSLEFDGTGDYLSIPPTSEFEFGTGDFTVECWFYASTVSGGEIPVYKQHGGVDAICEIRISSSKIYGKTATDQTVGAGTTTLSTNTWYHVAFVKSSNVYSLYLNGVSEGGTVTNATRINRPTTVRVGGNQTAVFFFTGYIDDLRVTKGVARYTANFTPPTAPFPNL